MDGCLLSELLLSFGGAAKNASFCPAVLLIGVVPLIGIIDIIVPAVVLLVPVALFIPLIGGCCCCGCRFTAFICGAMADGDDDDALAVGWLTGAIVVPVRPAVGRKIALVLLFDVFTGCCFGGVAVFVAVVVDFVVVVCCVDGDDDTADVGGVAADDAKGGFTVFGIPHIFDSVVLTTLRVGLLGSHIFALSSDDIGLPDGGSDDDDNDGDCCANT